MTVKFGYYIINLYHAFEDRERYLLYENLYQETRK